MVPGAAAVLVAGGVLAAWRAGVLSRPAASGGGQGAAAPATRPVVRGNLSVQTSVDGTLGYAGSYTVTGAGGGTLTSLPSAGQVIRQGQVLYTTDLTDPVVLLYGSVPDWRALDEGVTGAANKTAIIAPPRATGAKFQGAVNGAEILTLLK